MELSTDPGYEKLLGPNWCDSVALIELIACRRASYLKTAFLDMPRLSSRYLKYIRKFAATWPDRAIVQRTVAQLPWRSKRLRISGPENSETVSRNFIAFPRTTMILPASPALADLIKSPLVLEFLGLEEKPAYSENGLESAIIDKLEHFLLELGKGFRFEARQKRFTFDNDHFYVDLVFYNRLLRCYVLIDLKRDKLTHQDLGQMQMYVNYFDRFVKTEDELPTIGIVLCRRKNDALVELTLPKDASIFAPKYQLYLPSKEELKQQLEKIEAELGGLANGRCPPKFC